MLNSKRFVLATLFVLFAATASWAVGLAWDYPEGTDVAGFRIYQSSTPGQYDRAKDKVAEVSKDARQVTFTVLSPQDGKPVYFVGTAFDTAGNESDNSNEVSIVAPDKIPPGAPANFRLTVEMSLNGGQLTMRAAKIESNTD